MTMCDETIFNFEEERPVPNSYEDANCSPSDTDLLRSSAPPPSPECHRKSLFGEKNMIMEQLTLKLNCLSESNCSTPPVIIRKRAETISSIPMFLGREQMFPHNFMSLNSQNIFGLCKSHAIDTDDSEEMECENSYSDSHFQADSLGIRPEFAFTPSDSCEQIPVNNNIDNLPFIIGGLQPEGYKMNSLKRRTNDKLLNGPYPMPGQECSDISKRSRSARSSPPFVLCSHVSQSAPR